MTQHVPGLLESITRRIDFIQHENPMMVGPMFAVGSEGNLILIQIPRQKHVFLSMSVAENVYHTLLSHIQLAIGFPQNKPNGQAWKVDVIVPGNQVGLRFTPPNEEVRQDRVPMTPEGAARLAEAIKAAVTHIRDKEAKREV